MLDGATDSPGVEELARKIYGGALAMARVRRTRLLYIDGPTHYSLLWGIAAGFLGAYTLLLDLNIPLILQPQLFGVLSLVSWGQVCHIQH